MIEAVQDVLLLVLWGASALVFIGVWFGVAVMGALLIGRAIRMRDERESELPETVELGQRTDTVEMSAVQR